MLQNRIKTAENAILYTLLFLFPVFMMPGVSNPFVVAKLVLLALVLISILVLKSARNVSSKTRGLVFATSGVDLPILLLTLAYVVSGYLVTPNKLEAFWLPGTTSFMVGGALIYFVLHQLSEKSKANARLALVSGGALLSLTSVMVASGIFKGFQNAPAYLKTDVFSPAGSLLVSVILFAVLAPIALDLVMKSEQYLYKVVAGVALGLSVLAFFTSVLGVVKNWNAAQLPTLGTSWTVATESLKLKPFTGVGPGNYLSAFSRFIPVSYNATPQWATRFSNANNFYLTAITETGLIGLAALVVLILAFYKVAKRELSDGSLLDVLPSIIMFASFLFFPATPVLLILFFTTLALSTKTHIVHMFTPSHESAEATTEGKVASVIVAIPVIAVSLFALVLVAKEVRAEMTYQKALTAVTAQDGKLAYETLQSAINQSPYNDRFHITYSQLNLLLANTLTQKKDITEEDKKTISNLVQQAVREGRIAVVLNQERSGNWANLGSIYRSVIPLAKGADQFAVQTYSQAVILDPINPNTRVALGGIFYGLKRYEEAIDVFKLATSVKPDFANSHYNLAIAYRDNGQYDKSLAELTGVLSLVKKDTSDYTAIQKEIENVKSKSPKKTEAAAQTETLTPPTKIDESTTLNDKIALPQDATPPAAVATPTPSATPAQ